ncbi:MAG: imidazole glycerol phosphate synthase subunit HisH [Oscillospiraceae bacterium]|jgi:glutamine amidotransferase|nr:imidazole glycerol phosphate synthase subunit HisH [Oscillospiraceae bacterium]
MLAIVDYGAGNLRSVRKALDYLGAAVEITSDPAVVRRANAVLLPGVGSFADAMDQLRRRGLVEVLREAADGSRPFLGICLGLQLLFSSSEESPGAEGLGVLPGKVLRIPAGEGRKVPHMGWNSLELCRREGVLAGIPDDTYVYFVHSYYVRAGESRLVAARTEYGVSIDAAVSRGLLTATQFHPEKSGEAGLEMLRNFLGLRG